MKYIRNFNDHSIYNNVINDDYLNINKKVVSYCKNERHIHFDQYIDPYNGHAYVDLGLPSGTKWATMNVGALSETDYGDYYQYGKGSDTYDTTYEQSSYYGNEDPLSFSVDTASQVMGGQWHMPTLTQFIELKQNTNYSYTVINNVHGIKCTSKLDNSKYIFLPASGLYNQYGSKTGVDSNCYYWTSSPSTGGNSYIMGSVNGNNLNYSSEIRKLGLSVRGVIG